MDNIVIRIQPTGPTPEEPRVRHGDTVTFTLDGVVSAEVKFPDGTCLVNPGPFFLNNSTLASSNSTNSVTLTCAPDKYPFQVILPDAKHGPGNNYETKKGGLDVTTDPPKDPKKK
ncbi:hypothetical protein HUA74_33185 [Myxococcus sp. CA051A]|uniref:hypothetical protein n=1 Tax=unclassified Myxococcus TaxID=2648731 RepID=UPI00157AE8BF|nr:MULTISPECIES: hypothetical protein [unclassified Myxococcus]NTX39316.1 hypothetical protein [Myxococcus sp. CA033]NTX58566.1 hypothetical protein [Myxococcus sp. CA039A]NTX65523.1 hypothetical protein [Myxococcus sp. CA051A]